MRAISTDKVKINARARLSLKEAFATVREALAKRALLVIAGSCEVTYEGRAFSRLELGDRLVIVKRDGAVLVHRSTGYEPINWIPPGSIVSVEADGGRLKLRIARRKPHEVLVVSFAEVGMIAELNMVDKAEFTLYATERDMRDAILVRPDLIEEGFKPISREEPLKEIPGFVDVIGEDAHGNLVVIEIKRERASREAILQLKRYIEAVRSKSKRKVRGIIAAPGLAQGAQRLMEALGYDFKRLKPQSCAEILRKREVKGIYDYVN